jgi:hypothetical protein
MQALKSRVARFLYTLSAFAALAATLGANHKWGG